jgi:hypothetical protein
MDETPLDAPIVEEASPAAATQPAAKSSAQSLRELADSRWIVLGTLFLVTGVFGLPMLWISRGFSRAGKVVLSIVVTLYTVLLLWAFWIFMVYMWKNYYEPYL